MPRLGNTKVLMTHVRRHSRSAMERQCPAPPAQPSHKVVKPLQPASMDFRRSASPEELYPAQHQTEPHPFAPPSDDQYWSSGATSQDVPRLPSRLAALMTLGEVGDEGSPRFAKSPRRGFPGGGPSRRLRTRRGRQPPRDPSSECSVEVELEERAKITDLEPSNLYSVEKTNADELVVLKRSSRSVSRSHRAACIASSTSFAEAVRKASEVTGGNLPIKWSEDLSRGALQLPISGIQPCGRHMLKGLLESITPMNNRPCAKLPSTTEAWQKETVDIINEIMSENCELIRDPGRDENRPPIVEGIGNKAPAREDIAGPRSIVKDDTGSFSHTRSSRPPTPKMDSTSRFAATGATRTPLKSTFLSDRRPMAQSLKDRSTPQKADSHPRTESKWDQRSDTRADERDESGDSRRDPGKPAESRPSGSRLGLERMGRASENRWSGLRQTEPALETREVIRQSPSLTEQAPSRRSTAPAHRFPAPASRPSTREERQPTSESRQRASGRLEKFVETPVKPAWRISISTTPLRSSTPQVTRGRLNLTSTGRRSLSGRYPIEKIQEVLAPAKMTDLTQRLSPQEIERRLARRASLNPRLNAEETNPYFASPFPLPRMQRASLSALKQ